MTWCQGEVVQCKLRRFSVPVECHRNRRILPGCIRRSGQGHGGAAASRLIEVNLIGLARFYRQSHHRTERRGVNMPLRGSRLFADDFMLESAAITKEIVKFRF